MRTAAHLGPIFTLLRKVTGLGKLKVYHVKPNSIVVPGLAGMFQIANVCQMSMKMVDAHGHILDYGRQRQLDLHGATSIEGKRLSFTVTPVANTVKMSWTVSNAISMPTLTCSTIVLAGSKEWVGIRHDGKA